MSTRVKFDIENVCRTCLSATTSLRSLTALLCDDRTIYDILTDVIDEDIVLSEQLPYQICNECEIILVKYEKFRQTCLRNEEVLKNWIISTDDRSSVASQDGSESKDGTPVQYQCSICRTNYKNIPELEEHFSLVHIIKTDVSNELFCDIKPVTSDIKEEEEDTSDEANIDEPEIEIHTENVIVNELYEPNLNIKNNIDNVEQYNCEECKLEFQSSRALNIHLRKKHELPVKSAEIYKCPLCMRKFNKKPTLDLHIKRHEERARKTFTCTNCKREFKHQAHLDNHIKSFHKDIKEKDDETKQHSCNVCGKRFQMLSTLKEHYRVHTGEKPFLCARCGRSFSQKTNLKEHMRRHLGLKPFPCETCGLSFVSKGEMTAHQRKHTGAHPFICETCNGSFTTSSSLVKHRRIHTGERPFACDLCPMKFTASGTLKNHRRTHTGEKPYHCAHCDKAFVQRNDLVSHTRCHTGERPFVCSVCGHTFRQPSALKSHVKMHNFRDGSTLIAFQRKECLNGSKMAGIVCENSSSGSS